MRLELDLCAVDKKQHLPINYNYPLGQAVYNMMSNITDHVWKYYEKKDF
ncbi:MAG: hypothetical protein U5R06_11830 [candidate division KSB1 bacterium]|nr:hypothetical protein [candidate division KSB1 bacterium]